MSGKCYETFIDEYLWKVCFFKDVYQSSNFLGSFTNVDIAQRMIRFENGAGCPGGIRRNGWIKLRCGPENKMVQVGETSTCVYDVTFETPNICNLNEWNRESVNFWNL